MAEKSKRGTFIHGIAASEHLDSSGERIMIEGVDITSLTKDGTFNYEHDSKSPASIVGKILEAKKILKRADCDTEHQKYFWDKIKMPFIYVAGELFDSVGHKQAGEVAAMVRYDQLDALNKDAKRLINFSIEGSRVEKSGQIITKCIARKVSVTLTPCNKVCEAEELQMAPDAKKESDSGSFAFIQDIMSKADEPSCQIIKGENPFLYENKIAKTESVTNEKPKYLAPKGVKQIDRKHLQGGQIVAPKKRLSKYDSNVRKALTASCGVGASPSAKTGGAALQKEQLIYKNEEVPQAAPAQKKPSSGTKIGKTQSGKDVFSHGKVGEYQGFSPQDHVDAAEFHRQMVLKTPSFKDKEMHMQKIRLHNQAFSTGRNKEINSQAIAKIPGAKALPAQAKPAVGTNPQGTMGFSAQATNYGQTPAAPAAAKGAAPAKNNAPMPSAPAMPAIPAHPVHAANSMNPNMKMAKSEVFIIRKLSEPDVNKGSKNVREQRKKVFGTNSQPGANSSMREKHIAHIKQFVDKHLGLDLQPSGGKVNDKTGERRNAENEEGVDKPDWRSGKFEAQWNPEAIVHEIAHLMLLPKGVGLEEGQRLMDKQYSDVQKEHGYMQQKRSKYEVQPMAAEQLIRRAMGLPASKVSIPVKSKEDPHRMSLEDPSQPIATRIQSGKAKDGSPKYVDLIRQSRNLHPEHKQRLADIFSGKLQFHPDTGWGEKNKTLDAAITNRPPGAVMARQNKKQMAAPQPTELPPNVVRMKQPAPAAPAPAPAMPAQPAAEAPQQPPMKIAKSEQRMVMKMLGDQAFENFEKKEELLAFLAEKLPKLSERERLAIAKAVAYTNEKKKEAALASLMDEE